MAKKVIEHRYDHLGVICFVATVVSFLGIAYVSFIAYILAALLALVGMIMYKHLSTVDKPLLIISVVLLIVAVFQL